jgi:hypothetical protein
MAITLDRQVETRVCPGCGAPFAVLRGSFAHDGSPCGFYLIALHDHSPDGRRAHMAVTLLDEAEVDPRPRSVAVEVFTTPGHLGYRLIPWCDSPLGREAGLGKLLDPGDARDTLQFFGVAERDVKDVPEVGDYFGLRTARRNEFSNPVAALDGLPGFRRALMGLAALVSGGVAGLAGTGILYAVFVHPALLGRGLASTLGGSFLIVALFLALVWVRLWFGPRRWLDRAIDRMFLRNYIYIISIAVLVMIFATWVMIRGR